MIPWNSRQSITHGFIIERQAATNRHRTAPGERILYATKVFYCSFFNAKSLLCNVFQNCHTSEQQRNIGYAHSKLLADCKTITAQHIGVRFATIILPCQELKINLPDCHCDYRACRASTVKSNAATSRKQTYGGFFLKNMKLLISICRCKYLCFCL